MSPGSRVGFAVWVTLLAGVAFGQAGGIEPKQTVLLSGRLTDSHGTPIANATVVLNSATPGINESAMRTTQSGRFAFSVASNRSYKLHFAAPGFATLTLPVSVAAGTRILELPDTVLTVGPASTESPTSPAKQALSRATLPADLLSEIKKDLEKCLENGETIEQMIRTTWMKLGTGDSEELLVEGFGACAGANNWSHLVYAHLGGKWRKVFEGIGDRLDTLLNRTHGLLDLARLQHGSWYESDEYVYQFDGHEYKAVRCNEVEFADWETQKEYPTPKRYPCTWDWKESER
ncbi:MAG TPA: carboxypeptidase-like regulatory domain-containing protein [Bryobacteraceae bacterium]|jgi:hypothetical protein